MNRINQYDIEPGPYKDKDYQGEQGGANHKQTVVVVDIATHFYNHQTQQFETLPDPFVLIRDLDAIIDHKRFTYPLSIFKQKFYKS